MLQSVLGRVGAAYSNSKVNSLFSNLEKKHQTPILIPRVQVHLLLTTHRPHTRWRSSWRGRSSSVCPLPSPSSSKFLRSSLLPSSRSSSCWDWLCEEMQDLVTKDSWIWKGRPFLLISTKLHQVQSVTFSMLVQYQCSTCFYTLVYTKKQHLTWVLLLRINADF